MSRSVNADAAVLKITGVDLSPMDLSIVEYAGRELTIDPPLRLTPELDESEQLLTASDRDIGLDVFAPTREGLVEEVLGQLFFLWDTYAQSPDEQMTDSAKELKSILLTRLKESIHATPERHGVP